RETEIQAVSVDLSRVASDRATLVQAAEGAVQVARGHEHQSVSARFMTLERPYRYTLALCLCLYKIRRSRKHDSEHQTKQRTIHLHSPVQQMHDSANQSIPEIIPFTKQCRV